MSFFTKRFKRMKNKKGFTLVELIVVIVIVGILAAILIPRLTGFTNKAESTQALVWAKEVATAVDSYYAEEAAWPDNGDVAAIAKLSGVSSGAITLPGTGDGTFSVSYTKGSNTYTAGRATSSGAVEITGGL